jgi:hypothetical protein
MPAESIKASTATEITDPGYSGTNSNYCLLSAAWAAIEGAILCKCRSALTLRWQQSAVV